MRTIAIGLLVIGALAGVVAFLFESEESPPREVASTRPADREPARGPASAPHGLDSEPAADPSTAAHAREAVRTDAPASAADAPSTAESPTTRVRVVEAETGAAIAGARVWLVSRDAVSDVAARVASIANDPLPLLERLDPLGVTAADGSIDVVMPSTAMLLAAHAIGRFGAETADARPRQIQRMNRVLELRLFRDTDLRVEVVDAAGTPRPFVPVELLGHSFVSSSSQGTRILRAHADPAAAAVVIRHVRWRLAGGGDPYVDEHAHFTVRACIESLETDEVPIDERHLAGEPIRLVVPACAPVRVRLLQADGTRWPFEGVVQPLSDAFKNWPMRDGEVLFEAVEVDTPLRYSVRARDRRFPALEVVHAGGRTPWIETLLVAQLPRPEDARPVLVGRVLQSDGAPAAGVEMVLVGAGPVLSTRGTQRFRTAADGTFAFPYDDASPPPRRALVCGDGSAPAGDVRARVEFALPDPLTLGRHALGDLHLAATALAAAGHVRWQGGGAVDGARIDVEIVGRDGKSMRDRLDARTAADGSFRVHAHVPGCRLRLSARNDRLASASIEVDAGREDLVLELPRPSWIRGRVACDAGIAPSMLRLHVVQAKGASSGTIEADGTFEVALQVPGPGEVRITRGGGGAPFATIAQVAAMLEPRGADFVASDPRVDPIDLRGRLRVVTGRVLGPSDDPVESATVTEQHAGAVVRTGADGRFSWLSGEPAPELVVAAKGYRTLRVRVEAADVEIRLREPATRLTVTVPQELDLARFHDLVVWLGADAGPGRPPRVVAQASLVDRVATIECPEVGTFTLSVLAAPKGSARQAVPDLAIPVEIAPVASKEIALPLTQAQLDAIAKPPGS